MPPTISQQSRPAHQSRQQQGGQGKQVSFLCLPIDPDVNRISTPCQARDLPEIVPSALHIDVLRTVHAPVLVQVHHLAVPSPRFQFFAQPDQTHRPTAHRRRPVTDFQYALLQKPRPQCSFTNSESATAMPLATSLFPRERKDTTLHIAGIFSSG